MEGAVLVICKLFMYGLFWRPGFSLSAESLSALLREGGLF